MICLLIFWKDDVSEMKAAVSTYYELGQYAEKCGEYCALSRAHVINRWNAGSTLSFSAKPLQQNFVAAAAGHNSQCCILSLLIRCQKLSVCVYSAKSVDQ